MEPGNSLVRFVDGRRACAPCPVRPTTSRIPSTCEQTFEERERMDCRRSAVSRPEAPAPPAVVETAGKTPTPPPSVVVSEDIQKACGLPEPKAYFAYKSSKLRSHDQSFLKSLARCFTAGPLQKRQIQLVGHADPRGSEAYNYVLGQRRAESVKVAMLGLGMQTGQISTSSRGKQEAVGSNEVGWAKDRRVEARLGH